MVSIISELDCLVSLAVTSLYQDGPMCRPQIIGYTGDYKRRGFIEIRQMRNPCCAKKIDPLTNEIKPFVPNDIVINENPERKTMTLLVTGPNMGGKSTLHRQTCYAAILS